MADVARRAGPGMSAPADRLAMLEHAQELEAEAAGLEAEAAELEGQMPPRAAVPPVVVHQQMQMQMQQQLSTDEPGNPDEKPKGSN
jgi:hypothetical protein